jgi:hypothetical protein
MFHIAAAVFLGLVAYEWWCRFRVARAERKIERMRRHLMPEWVVVNGQYVEREQPKGWSVEVMVLLGLASPFIVAAIVHNLR